MTVIALALAGSSIAAALGVTLPADLAASLAANKLQILMGAFFVGNMLQGALLNTGAFEVSVGGELVFSKLATGRMPTLPELFASVGAAEAVPAQ
jgi:selT/selW/selH-like putative selenoprotein